MFSPIEQTQIKNLMKFKLNEWSMEMSPINHNLFIFSKFSGKKLKRKCLYVNEKVIMQYMPEYYMTFPMPRND